MGRPLRLVSGGPVGYDARLNDGRAADVKYPVSDVIAGSRCPELRETKMISSTDLLSYLKAEPFRPIRIHMASGATFDVRHPEMAKVGRNSVILFTFVSDNPEIFDRWETVSLVLMERVSQLDATVSPNRKLITDRLLKEDK